MNIKEQIIRTLENVSDKLKEIKSDWYIIGSSALILSNVDIAKTSDIDILTTDMGSNEIQMLLKDYIVKTPITKENNLFRSNFAQFNLPLMDIEVMGELQVNKNGVWKNVYINEFQQVSVGKLIVKIPTLDEQKRLFLLFGRNKDLDRLKYVQNNRQK